MSGDTDSSEFYFLCPEGHLLGIFSGDDDHGGMAMKCPECGRWVNLMNAAFYSPEDFGGVGFNTEAEVKAALASGVYNGDSQVFYDKDAEWPKFIIVTMSWA
jgi:hypothetical protein